MAFILNLLPEFSWLLPFLYLSEAMSYYSLFIFSIQTSAFMISSASDQDLFYGKELVLLSGPMDIVPYFWFFCLSQNPWQFHHTLWDYGQSHRYEFW